MARPKRIFTDKEQKLIVALYQEGKIDQEIADLLGMPRSTYQYALKSNRLVGTIKRTKEIPDRKVEKALYKRAIGYKYIERKRERSLEPARYPRRASVKTEGEYPKPQVSLKRTVTVKEVPPEVTACIYWLGNRNPKRWRNKQEIEHTGIGFKQIIIVSSGKVEDELGKKLRQATGKPG